MDDPRSRTGSMLGDYRLENLIGESPITLTWLAEQASIRRPVVLFELKPTALNRREDFLADIRAKAAVDHPLVGSVYEAVSTDEHCYVTLERLPGSSLMDRIRAKEAIKPAQLANILRRVADANLALESEKICTASLGPDDIFVDSHAVVRVANLARAEERSPTRSAEDIVALGKALPRLVADGHSGASRMITLLAWMRGEGLDRSLTWEEVRGYAEQIEQQLSGHPMATAPKTTRVEPRKSPLPLILGVAGIVFLGGIAALALRSSGSSKNATMSLPPPVDVPAGGHPLPDGGTGNLPAFSLSGHEVTIGEYAEFLAALSALAPERRTAYDHKDQPASKQDHEPESWTVMFSSAKTGSEWEGRAITTSHPVVNVDWWDAAAYCEWKRCRLPTQEEWFAALRLNLADPSSLRPASWAPVPELPPTDTTPSGLSGMAGSVSEWTSSLSLNPANPLGEKSWVIIGGSHLNPGNGALTREWVLNRSLRRPDLGFRVVEK
ncbi:SUMF1/EgtB/PvdO family nonheme iron enzyme [Luteolibacter luteus]|uniref:SUMF1/EgtB/PvdO family nonheme iron enzyme n=1 Tax=Luteolibacter luteus TaxID=2728835 RepID=A0A858RLB3_9BACT|nr:SUMF1/EgtB/PvdO family nonheme iron enzyme [Luteolibacter luteus]QJE96793.1 SUMF1/EgtB/PvdO family nonheme iron enzyme [Luteolibacter luteus]